MKTNRMALRGPGMVASHLRATSQRVRAASAEVITTIGAVISPIFQSPIVEQGTCLL